MKIMNCDVDLIIPVYNPQVEWHLRLYDRLSHLFSHLPNVTFHLIIVDDCSNSELSDSRTYISQHFETTMWLQNSKNEGKGAALKYGMSRSESPFVMYTDADIPYTSDSMKRVVEAVISGKNDVSVSVRNNGYYSSLPYWRKVISKGLRFFNNKVLKLSIADTQGGLKAMNKYGKDIFLNTRSNRYSTDLEFLIRSTRNHLKIAEVDVEIYENSTSSTINIISLLKEVGEMLRILIRN